MVLTKIRNFESLLKDLEEIEYACNEDPKKIKIDPFTKVKMQIIQFLERIKEDIDFVSKNANAGGEIVRVKLRVRRDFEVATNLKDHLEKAIQKNEKDYKDKKSDLSKDDMRERRKVYALILKDFSFVESKIQRQEKDATKNVAAKTERDRRLELRKQKLKQTKKGNNDEEESLDEPPLTEQEQEFLTRSFKKDQQIDEQLDLVHEKLKILNVKAVDINEKIKEQGRAIDKMGEKVDGVTDKMVSTSQKLEMLLQQTGGLTRWIPMIIMGLLIIAAVGYLFKMIF